MNIKTALKIRKTHRYLGIFLGIQFLMWTISGLYFSWTDIDEIHGDYFKKEIPHKQPFLNLLENGSLRFAEPITTLELKDIAGEPYFWVNDDQLINAYTGAYKKEITKEEAIKIAENFMLAELEVKSVKKLDSTGPHHEYRGKPLPAYEISYKSAENITAYVSITNGAFQTVRHRNWRWFDFLWMTHTMDYQGRDNFNTIVLRAFSLLGLFTVLSGFLLWFSSSKSIKKLKKKFK